MALIAVLDVIPNWQGLTRRRPRARRPGDAPAYHVGLVDDGTHRSDDGDLTFAEAGRSCAARAVCWPTWTRDRLATITEISANNTHLTVDYRPGPVDGEPPADRLFGRSRIRR